MEATPDGRGRVAKGRHGPLAPGEGWRRIAAKIPTAAVIVVVFTAVITTLVLTRRPGLREEDLARSVVAPAEALTSVVTAPPLAAPAGLLNNVTAGKQGSGGVCRDCGVVESVMALTQAHDGPAAYQMRIRMDDGSVRTFEQRAALAAGSRVVVARGLVRPASQPG